MSVATELAGSERETELGTRRADSWDKKWIAEVNRREAQQGRRICGARTVGGTPCTLPSNHDSGRCPHHGGAELTGAPEGNRNAAIHNLYSRRLMVCGTHCPAWKSCPLGGGSSSTFSLGKEKVEPKETDVFGSRIEIREPGEVEGGSGFQHERDLRGVGAAPGPHGRATHATTTAQGQDAGATDSTDGKSLTYAQYLMRLPPSERPLCPIEQSEYNAVVTDVQFRTGACSRNALGRHLAHHVALLTVMVNRASRSLTMKPITEKIEHSGDTFYMASEKPAAGLVALEKLSRELRMWVRHIEQSYSIHTDPDQRARTERAYRVQRDTSPDPAVANDYEANEGEPTCDGIDDEGRIGFDQNKWDLVEVQQNLIEDLYRRLHRAAERGFFDEADSAPVNGIGRDGRAQGGPSFQRGRGHEPP